jgi:hypothetical protein
MKAFVKWVHRAFFEGKVPTSPPSFCLSVRSLVTSFDPLLTVHLSLFFASLCNNFLNGNVGKEVIPFMNGMIIPLPRSETRRVKKKDSEDLSEGDDAEDREVRGPSEFDYFRVFCNSEEISKLLKEDPKKKKEATPAPVRVPNLEAVTHSLSPFASNYLGGSMFFTLLLAPYALFFPPLGLLPSHLSKSSFSLPVPS